MVILMLLWARMPHPHQVWAPLIPVSRARSQPYWRFRVAMRPSDPVRHFTRSENGVGRVRCPGVFGLVARLGG